MYWLKNKAMIELIGLPLRRLPSRGHGYIFFLLVTIHFQLSCIAKGVFHVTVPASPKVSIFNKSFESYPTIVMQEDSTERKNFILSLPREVFEETTQQGVLHRTCSELLVVTSSDEAVVQSSNISIADVDGGCEISFHANPNSSGDLVLTGVSKINPEDQIQIPVSITPLNDPPAIADFNAVISGEDKPQLITIPLLDDTPGLTCATAITSTSNNEILIPTSSLIISGTVPNCELTYTPLTDQAGSAKITLLISDGEYLITKTISVSVTPINDPPVISDVTNQTTSEGIAISGIPVSISDPDTLIDCSSITAISTNTTLIPSGNVIVSGTSTNCLISLVPVPSQTGISTITLTVSDTVLSMSDSFIFTTNAINKAPTDIAISNLSLAENSGANAMVGALSATDPNPGDTFTYSLVTGPGSTDNTAFTINGSQLYMIGSADFETQSSYTMRLRAMDQGSLFFEKQISISIININEPPSLAAIADQTTVQNISSSAIPLTVTDPDGPNGICNATYLSYTSQNTSIVAAAGGITWSGTWPNCTAVISPVPGSSGSTLIAISVSDGSLTSSPQSFNLTVNSLPQGWYQEAYIKASNANYGDYFGTSIGISADTAIVGAAAESSNQTTITNGTTSSLINSASMAGASYVYRRQGATWTQEAYLKASNADGAAMGGDEYGWAVSIDKDTAIVGAPSESSNQSTITNGPSASQDNSLSSSGASYVYKRTGTTWSQEAYLKASNVQLHQSFSNSVDIAGDTAIVGAYNESSSQTTITNGISSSLNLSSSQSGACYIFKRTSSQWTQEAYLKASNGNTGDGFCRSASISGETVIVGATGEASNQTFITNGTTSSQDNTANGAGASYIFRRTGSIWAQEAYLKASNANAMDSFGNTVSIAGDTVIVGARYESSNQTIISNGSTASADNSAINSGATYIYRRSGNLWTQEAYIKASNANSSDKFGDTVAISGNTAAVGAGGEASNQTTITNGTTSSTINSLNSSGAAYIYKRTGTIWSQEAYVKASNASFLSVYFGNSISLAGDTAIVGAYHEASSQTTITNGTHSSLDRTAMYSGAAYVYRNIGRLFEVSELAASTTSTSITLNWNGANIGSGNGQFKVVYSTATPSAQCNSGTVAYTGTASAASINAGLTPGQKYIVRICTFDGANYSEGVTSEVTVKGDDTGPTVLTINRGSTANPVAFGTALIDYVVTFNEPVIGLNTSNFSFTEFGTTGGATGNISSISCAGAVCTVWVAQSGTGQLRIDLSNSSGVGDIWGNALISGKIGDQTYLLNPAGGWYQEAFIKASNAAAPAAMAQLFGSSVSISGDTAIVGAMGEATIQNIIVNGTTSFTDTSAPGSGASYIYRRSGATWNQEAYIKASNAESYDYFGIYVSISGDSAIVSAKRESSAQNTITNGQSSSYDNTSPLAGASYVYRRNGLSWAQEAYIKASNAEASDNFGDAVVIAGDTALVGASQEDSSQIVITNGTTSSADNAASGAGAGYLYRRSGTIWAQEAYLKAANANGADSFGISGSLSGDTAIIGAIGEASRQTIITNGTTASINNSWGGAGASYIYRRTAGIWAQEAYLKASNANANYYFGHSVSISGDTAFVGSIFEASNQTVITNGTTSSINTSAVNSGASYVYKRTGTSWTQEAYLKASNSGASHYYGGSVYISGDTAVVGAYGESSGQTTITNGTLSSLDNFASGAGAAYIYRRTGTSWAQEAYMKSSNPEVNDGLGNSVALSGDSVIVGASNEDSNQTFITNGQTASTDNTATDSGAVFVYRNLSRIFDPDLWISGKTTTSITLSWGKNLGSTIRVKIAPAVSGTGNPLPCTDASAVTLAAGVTTYTYTGLTTSTRYGFRVCGFDGTNVSQGTIIRDSTP